MREEIHLSENYLERFEVFELFLQDFVCFLKVIGIYKWKTYVNMRFPAFICRIIRLPQSLNIFIVLLCNDSQCTVSYQLASLFLHLLNKDLSLKYLF